MGPSLWISLGPMDFFAISRLSSKYFRERGSWGLKKEKSHKIYIYFFKEKSEPEKRWVYRQLLLLRPLRPKKYVRLLGNTGSRYLLLKNIYPWLPSPFRRFVPHPRHRLFCRIPRPDPFRWGDQTARGMEYSRMRVGGWVNFAADDQLVDPKRHCPP